MKRMTQVRLRWLGHLAERMASGPRKRILDELLTEVRRARTAEKRWQGRRDVLATAVRRVGLNTGKRRVAPLNVIVSEERSDSTVILLLSCGHTKAVRYDKVPRRKARCQKCLQNWTAKDKADTPR